MRTAFRLGLFAAAVLALATPRVVRAQGQSPDQPSVAPTEAPPAQPAEPVAQPAEPAVQPADAPPTTPEAALPPEVKPAEVEEIVVTGSRINRADLNTPAPITVVDKKAITQSGHTSVGDVIQALPAQGNAINAQVNNGGDGSSSVSLRSLGSQRTLVLLNGRRFVGNDASWVGGASVDLNAIPTAAIERIEILKDGASTIYGSDAIGGVVNIITKKNWQGTEANVFMGTTQHGDGSTIDVNVTTGMKGDRGNFLFSAGYEKQYPVWAGDRGFAATPYTYDFPSGQLSSTGSSTTPDTVLVDREAKGGVTPGNQAWQDIVTGAGGAKARNYIYDESTGTFRKMNSLGIAGGPEGGDLYNYAPKNYLFTPMDRINLFMTGNLKLGDLAKAYVEATFTNRKSRQELAPEPVQTALYGINVSADNAYNPYGRDFSSIKRRMVEIGDRTQDEDVNTFRVVAGLNGHLPEALGPLHGWFWDASFNYGRTMQTVTYGGNLIVSHLQNALGPSYFDAQGVPHCGSDAAHEIAGCVPLNLFGPVGSITKDMKDYLTFSGTSRSMIEMSMLSLSATGDLFTLFANRPAALAIGYELRHEAGSYSPDPLTATGDTTGNAASPVAGAFTVNEGYLELSLPIVSGKPAFHDFEIIGSLRAFNYNNFGSDFTWKLGAKWAIVRDFSIRGTYSTAYRAPNINELFSGQSDSFPNFPNGDPCSTVGPNGPRTLSAKVAAQCAAQGVPADLNDPSNQFRERVGGNTGLKPETAQTVTAGAVFEPRWVKGLSITADYYNITVSNTVQSIGTDVILQGCYNFETGTQPKYCDLIERDSHGNISRIIDTLQNVGSIRTGGLDFGLRYDWKSPIGLFIFSGELAWLQDYDVELASGKVIHGKDNYDEGINPSVKAIAGITWGYKGVSAGIHGKFLSSFRECDGGLCSVDSGTATPNYRQVPAYAAFDIFLGYDLKTVAGTTGMMVGVNNLFNVDPPAIYTAFANNADPSAYDAMGRYFYFRLSQSF